MRRSHFHPAGLAAVGLATLAACALLGQAALETGRTFLQNVAGENYGADYVASLDKMLNLLTAQVGGTRATGSPGASPLGTSLDGSSRSSAEPEGAGAQDAALALEVAVMREAVLDGRVLTLPVEDGDVLRDGVGREHPGDGLRIRFTASQPCWVYAVWVDATAWAQPVFPGARWSRGSNPVEPGTAYTLPDGDFVFDLDDYRGVETLYFLASRERVPELEKILADLDGKERTLRGDVAVPAAVEQPAPITRGLAGKRKSLVTQVQSTQGSVDDVPAETFFAQLAHGDLVVTRWFRHE